MQPFDRSVCVSISTWLVLLPACLARGTYVAFTGCSGGAAAAGRFHSSATAQAHFLRRSWAAYLPGCFVPSEMALQTRHGRRFRAGVVRRSPDYGRCGQAGVSEHYTSGGRPYWWRPSYGGPTSPARRQVVSHVALAGAWVSQFVVLPAGQISNWVIQTFSKVSREALTMVGPSRLASCGS